MSRDRAVLPPLELAQEIIKVVGDADECTARAALEIAGVLLRHRTEAEIEFVSESSRQCT